MAYMLFEIDPIAKWSLVAGVVGAAAAIIGAVAAIFAAVYAKAAPTKGDLARVEQNTAITSGHLENVHRSLKTQEERGALNDRAQRVSMTASGRTDVNCPMDQS